MYRLRILRFNYYIIFFVTISLISATKKIISSLGINTKKKHLCGIFITVYNYLKIIDYINPDFPNGYYIFRIYLREKKTVLQYLLLTTWIYNYPERKKNNQHLGFKLQKIKKNEEFKLHARLGCFYRSKNKRE